MRKPQISKNLYGVLKYVKGNDVLDIGAGHGNNSLFLAEKGFEVTAIDKNCSVLKQTALYAKKNKLSVLTRCVDIRDFKFVSDKYSLVLSVTALDFLRTKQICKLIDKIYRALKIGGIFFIVVFSNKDISFKNIKESGAKIIEKNTFYFKASKSVRHYFTKNELKNMLAKFIIIELEEKPPLLNKKHSHHLVVAIAQK